MYLWNANFENPRNKNEEIVEMNEEEMPKTDHSLSGFWVSISRLLRSLPLKFWVSICHVLMFLWLILVLLHFLKDKTWNLNLYIHGAA